MNKNQELAKIFDRIADVLEFKGDLVFKVNAYRRAARALQELSADVSVLAEQGSLETIPGIGRAIAEKIREYLQTGWIAKYEEVSRQVPPALMDLLQIPSLGPRTLARLHRELGVRDIESLKEALDSGRAQGLPGMGVKRVENIRRGLELFQSGRGRLFLGQAYPLAWSLVRDLRRCLGNDEIVPAGSLRRMKETIGDIDILAACRDGRKAVEAFVSLPSVARILSAGDTKASILTQDGLQVDLRVVEERSFGAALQYFTGSKEHNVRLREMARKKGMTLSEYGVFRLKDNRYLAGRSEPEVYRKLGLPWIPPEMREDQGEIQAALSGRLPELVEIDDIQGDLHVHSHWSDGHDRIEELAEAAYRRGYRYLAICDHSASAAYAGGLSPAKLAEQIKYIRRYNAEKGARRFRLLSGVECDIRPDGTLDLPERLLSQLDVVVASIHSAFTRNITERLIRACRHPQVDIIAHPTGRLLHQRDGYQGLDLEKVMQQAAQTQTALEINAYHQRLDLSDQQARRAAELGCRLVINTDSHRASDLWMMELGVGLARRAWLTKNDILNCRSWDKIKRRGKGGL